MKLAAFQIAALVVVCGCGTVSTRVKDNGGPYSGLGHDMEKICSGKAWTTWSIQGRAGDWPFPCPQGLLWVADAPLSFVADTVLLPVDALTSRTNRVGEAQETCSRTNRVVETEGAGH